MTQQLTGKRARVTTMVPTAASKKLRASENNYRYVLHCLGEQTFRTPGYINKAERESSITFQGIPSYVEQLGWEMAEKCAKREAAKQNINTQTFHCYTTTKQEKYIWQWEKYIAHHLRLKWMGLMILNTANHWYWVTGTNFYTRNKNASETQFFFLQ